MNRKAPLDDRLLRPEEGKGGTVGPLKVDRPTIPLAPISSSARNETGVLAFRIVGAYLAVGMLFLMVSTGGAPFVPSADFHWRTTMPEYAVFLAVTAAMIFSLAHHGFTEVVRARQEAAQSKIELVHRLAVVAEWKDDTIGGHNYRIAHSAHIIGAEMGLPERQLHLMFHGAVLHDIGKVGMPDHLLRKNGIFTSEERVLMERHVILGAALLEGSNDELLIVSRLIALSHHENWDGSGYPYGLSGADIPLEGRIVAVCDVLDALLSRRPYKEPWDGQDAVEFILEQRGRKFDPDIVDAMLRVLPQLIAAREDIPGEPWVAWHVEADRLLSERENQLDELRLA